MIDYKINGRIITNELNTFFQNWKSPPSTETRSKLLTGSDLVITAREDGRLVGFLTAISDGAMHAFITLLEVLESHQNKGIGKHLMELAISNFKGYYDIVLITDPDKGEFYKKLGFREIYGMHIRDFTYGKDKK
ncbi:MAG: GNAT family N-acetyltransferase [candidate division Zixibacteria bacterium]|nr:GNAT family N-acetyltransferase [candidate division Zixibacteria bacterium]